MGPGGALVVLVVVGRAGFNFFTEMIKKQDEKYDRQVERLDKMHVSTLEHIHAQTLMTGQQTEVLRTLNDNIKGCPGAGDAQPAKFSRPVAAIKSAEM